MKIQSVFLLFSLVGMLLASPLNRDNSEEEDSAMEKLENDIAEDEAPPLLEEDDLKGEKAALEKLFAAVNADGVSLKTVGGAEDEAASLLEDDLKGEKAALEKMFADVNADGVSMKTAGGAEDEAAFD